MHNALLCKENLERSKPAWRSQLGIPTIPSAGLRILTTWPNSAQVLASPRGLPLLFSAMWVEEPGTNCRGDTKVPGHHAMLLWDLSPGEHPRKRSKADILTCFESNKGGLSSWFALYASSCGAWNSVLHIHACIPLNNDLWLGDTSHVLWLQVFGYHQIVFLSFSHTSNIQWTGTHYVLYQLIAANTFRTLHRCHCQRWPLSAGAWLGSISGITPEWRALGRWSGWTTNAAVSGWKQLAEVGLVNLRSLWLFLEIQVTV